MARRTTCPGAAAGTPISSRSTGTAPPCMSSAIGPGIPRGSAATSRARSAPKNMRARNWSPRWRAPSSAPSLGIVPTVRHADYIGSWLEVLREDNRAIVRAASAASQGRRLSARLSSNPSPRDGGARRPRNASAAVRWTCRWSPQRVRGGGVFRDGLEVERESLGCPSWRIRMTTSSEDQTVALARHSFQQAGAEPVQCAPRQSGHLDRATSRRASRSVPCCRA